MVPSQISAGQLFLNRLTSRSILIEDKESAVLALSQP
jgi:hypothetical protein